MTGTADSPDNVPSNGANKKRTVRYLGSMAGGKVHLAWSVS